VLLLIPGFIAEEELTAEQQQQDAEARREIDASLVSRVVSSWKTWAIVYVLGALLMVALYFI